MAVTSLSNPQLIGKTPRKGISDWAMINHGQPKGEAIKIYWLGK